MTRTHDLIGITMGCPAGIGPEIICRFFATAPAEARCVVLGDINILRAAASLVGLRWPVVPWQSGDSLHPQTVPVLETSSLDPFVVHLGKPDAITGKAMAAAIIQAVELCQAGVLAAMVTCPIAKKTLHEAGYPYPGHTEMLAALTHAPEYRMMMHGSRLKVVLVTIHEPLAAVPGLLSEKSITACIESTAVALQRDFAIAEPRIAVAGLNPHGGEQGLFGLEEERVILPAVKRCRERWQVSGPWPPDTVFYQAAAGAYDVVVAMYHDQGLIPFKLLHFRDGVNVTLGLPIVRTSVDHGTAYDIAGRGVADPASLAAACTCAFRIAANRRRWRERG